MVVMDDEAIRRGESRSWRNDVVDFDGPMGATENALVVPKDHHVAHKDKILFTEIMILSHESLFQWLQWSTKIQRWEKLQNVRVTVVQMVFLFQ
jgi:hypothetical protein